MRIEDIIMCYDLSLGSDRAHDIAQLESPANDNNNSNGTNKNNSSGTNNGNNNDSNNNNTNTTTNNTITNTNDVKVNDKVSDDNVSRKDIEESEITRMAVHLCMEVMNHALGVDHENDHHDHRRDDRHGEDHADDRSMGSSCLDVASRVLAVYHGNDHPHSDNDIHHRDDHHGDDHDSDRDLGSTSSDVTSFVLAVYQSRVLAVYYGNDPHHHHNYGEDRNDPHGDLHGDERGLGNSFSNVLSRALAVYHGNDLHHSDNDHLHHRDDHHGDNQDIDHGLACSFSDVTSRVLAVYHGNDHPHSDNDIHHRNDHHGDDHDSDRDLGSTSSGVTSRVLAVYQSRVLDVYYGNDPLHHHHHGEDRNHHHGDYHGDDRDLGNSLSGVLSRVLAVYHGNDLHHSDNDHRHHRDDHHGDNLGIDHGLACRFSDVTSRVLAVYHGDNHHPSNNDPHHHHHHPHEVRNNSSQGSSEVDDRESTRTLQDLLVGTSVWVYGDLVAGNLPAQYEDVGVGSSCLDVTSRVLTIYHGNDRHHSANDHHHRGKDHDDVEEGGNSPHGSSEGDNSELKWVVQDLFAGTSVWVYGDLVVGNLPAQHEVGGVGSSCLDVTSRVLTIYHGNGPHHSANDHHHRGKDHDDVEGRGGSPHGSSEGDNSELKWAVQDLFAGTSVWVYGDLVVGNLPALHDDVGVGSSYRDVASRVLCLYHGDNHDHHHHHHHGKDDDCAEGEDNSPQSYLDVEDGNLARSLRDFLMGTDVWVYGDLGGTNPTAQHDDVGVGSSCLDVTSRAICLYNPHDNHDDDDRHRHHVDDNDNRNDEDHRPKDALDGEDGDLARFLHGFLMRTNVWVYGDLDLTNPAAQHADLAVTSRVLCVYEPRHDGHRHHHRHVENHGNHNDEDHGRQGSLDVEDSGLARSLRDVLMGTNVWVYGDLGLGNLSAQRFGFGVGSSRSDATCRVLALYHPPQDHHDHHHHEVHDTAEGGDSSPQRSLGAEVCDPTWIMADIIAGANVWVYGDLGQTNPAVQHDDIAAGSSFMDVASRLLTVYHGNDHPDDHHHYHGKEHDDDERGDNSSQGSLEGVVCDPTWTLVDLIVGADVWESGDLRLFNLAEPELDDLELWKLSEQQHDDLGRGGRSKQDSTRITLYGMCLSFSSRVVCLVSVLLYWVFLV